MWEQNNIIVHVDNTVDHRLLETIGVGGYSDNRTFFDNQTF